MTNKPANSSTLASNAFDSEEELGKTLAQELYRLNYSKATGAGVESATASMETAAAAKFADNIGGWIAFGQ